MPELFTFIEKKLHILPLWTGITFQSGISLLQKKNQLSNDAKIKFISSLSNNYVENRFGTIKRDIMKKSKPCLPSDIVPKLYCLIKVILSHIHRRMHPKIIFLFYIIFYEIRMRFAK